jgi:[acyl-carrier-protein] S-malonyltransferase
VSAKRTLLVCPGRGSYTAGDLHSLDKWRTVPGAAERAQALIAAADDYRAQVGSPLISELDGAERYQASWHAPGENAGPLIFTCSAVDAALLPRELYRPVAVCGNSMGWYTALGVAGALELVEALRVVDTMSKTQREGITGGQLIIPWVDDEWRPDPALRRAIDDAVRSARAGGAVAEVSIELGGFVVLGGDERGLAALKGLLPARTLGKRDYPFQLLQHAAFHTSLMTAHSEVGRRELADLAWRAPSLPMIDGRGVVWRPLATDVRELAHYTFVPQALETYDFTLSLRVALREYAPDVIVLLGPGDTLGGAIGQTLVIEGWQGLRRKSDFLRRQESADPILIALGRRGDFERYVAVQVP